jgi:nicotinamide-nucleotide amidase
MFARRNREMPERNIVQAMFPQGAEPISNRRGTAPGIYMEIPRAGRAPCRLAAMPGVPSEMKVMFRDEVLPRIKPAQNAGLVIRTARINCFGVGESAAEQMLGDVTARGRDPEVGITVHEATITLRIVATAPSVPEALDKIATTTAIIYERMGDYAFGEEDDELEHVVVRMLSELNQTLAIVESATGGLLAQRVTSVAGSEKCFKGALVAVDEAAAVQRFTQFTLAPDGRNGAIAMALNCRLSFGTDWALAVGKCSRSYDNESESKAPIVYIALADPDSTCTAIELNVAGDPAIVKSRVAKSALNLLRLKVMKGR